MSRFMAILLALCILASCAGCRAQDNSIVAYWQEMN